MSTDVLAPGGRTLRRLTEVLDPSEITWQEADLEAAAADRSGLRLPGRPLALVTPTSVESVRAALRVAHAAGVTVVPRGAGSGLSGGAAVPDGALVLSTVRLNRIIEIDPVDGVAVVEPGVIVAQLDADPARHGLLYPPDPASHEIATVGGTIATNAGGLRCVKYGVTRDSVLGLTVVLADGSLLRTGRRTLKGVVGYDLTGLFVGSEGTLGVVVEATVRLLPRPVQTRTAAAFFDSVTDAAAAVTGVTRTGARPSALELLDGGALRAIDRAQGTDLAASGEALLLAQTDGFGAEAEIDAVAAALTRAGGRVELPDDAAGQRYFWLRRHGRGFTADDWLIGEDVAVPRSALPAAVAAIGEIARRHEVTGSVVAHIGDGNLHPVFSTPRTPSDLGAPPARLYAAADELVRTALALGGTITGEHGVGIAKRPWLDEELDARSIDLQRRLKAVLDPTGILNPHTWLAPTAEHDTHHSRAV
jgi:glycolate oxidase